MTARETEQPRALRDRLRSAPFVPENQGEEAKAILAELSQASPALAPLLTDAATANLVAGTCHGSRYLRGLITRNPGRLASILTTSPEARLGWLTGLLSDALGKAGTLAEAMRPLRIYKQEVALLTALADLGGVWPVMTVTRTLTEASDAALAGAVAYLFREAAARGDWLPRDPAAPEAGSGYFVLGVGKYGAHELNYSSDIDLIVFYEPALARVRSGLDLATFFVRLTRDLVRLIDERTADGYVFRTDLRLRPDAGATQIALSTDAAAIYYESFGQNWERAALIKARAVAGDLEAGEAFLSELAPFIWRRSLDFAAIADIHAMKRQIHAFRGFGDIGVAGHNIKLGPGGIREIEFFAQTQQLIAGGRQRSLRVRRTLDALGALVAMGWIKEATAHDLTDAYLFLRRIEHRIQMVADEQTHELPDDEPQLESLAHFAAYPTLAEFSHDLLEVLRRVQGHYARLFEKAPELTTAAGANLMFAGEEDDPGTVEALRAMGYQRPSDVLAAIRGWHHGRYPAVRSARARELLTEVQPLLAASFAETSDPDRAIASFDRFLAELPAGVQLFSLLKANPALMRLVADIMGTAPRLARILSRRRRLLDAVIDPRTFAALPNQDEIAGEIETHLAGAADLQEILDRVRIYGSEQAFLVGVKVLSGAINASQAGATYALLAIGLIRALSQAASAEIEAAHGKIQGGAAAVVAMGKLGGREMTASSDVDLIVIYDYDPVCSESDGGKPLAPSQYYARFTQRLISALSAPTAEGTLYEVDMRLRPSGQMGPVAAQLSTFREYQATEAWTWEHMALTRARVVSGPPELREKVEAAIRDTLLTPRDRAKVVADVLDMRKRIEAEKGTDNIWDLKQVRGGLVDLEFIAQFLELVHASAYPQILDQNTAHAFQKLAAHGLLAPEAAEQLMQATRLIHNLTQVLRLCIEDPFDPETAPPGLKSLLARAGNAPDFANLETTLRQTLADVKAQFDKIIV